MLKRGGMNLCWLIVLMVGWAGSGSQVKAQSGTWQVLSLPQQPGQVYQPEGVVVDGLGDLFVSDFGNNRIQVRDPQGNWTILASPGFNPGQVEYPTGVAMDGSGNLFAADEDHIQKRDAQGNWTVLASFGFDT